MIRAFNQNKFLRLRGRGHQRLQLCPRTELIARAADKQFRFRALAQKIQCIGPRHFRVGSHRNRRNTNTDQSLYPLIRTCGAQPHGGAERKSREYQGQMKLRIEPVDRRPDIFDLAMAVIVFALAESGAAKVETQYGKTKTVQRLHGVEHDLVMQRPTK